MERDVEAGTPVDPDVPVVPDEEEDAAEASSVPAGEEAELRAQEYLALAQRTQADFENFRKRSSRDVAAAQQRGAMKVVRELLPALDDLERALAHAGDEGAAEGLRLVQGQLQAALVRVGVEGYSPEGEQFDPTVHEAMTQQPVEGTETGTVVEVFQRGYRLDGTVIRPARVVVAA